MDRKEAINLALTLFRQDLDRNDVVTTLMKSNIPESTAYRYTKKAYEQYEWEMDKEESAIKCFELKALDTIYKASISAITISGTGLSIIVIIPIKFVSSRILVNSQPYPFIWAL